MDTATYARFNGSGADPVQGAVSHHSYYLGHGIEHHYPAYIFRKYGYGIYNWRGKESHLDYKPPDELHVSEVDIEGGQGHG